MPWIQRKEAPSLRRAFQVAVEAFTFNSEKLRESFKKRWTLFG